MLSVKETFTLYAAFLVSGVAFNFFFKPKYPADNVAAIAKYGFTSDPHSLFSILAWLAELKFGTLKPQVRFSKPQLRLNGVPSSQ